MKSRLVAAVFVLVCVVQQSFAQDLSAEIQKRRQEIAALKKMRMEKTEALEQAESSRWNARYQHQEELRLLEADNRDLESQYGAVANMLNRRREDILLLQSSLEQEQQRLSEEKLRLESFTRRLSQTITQRARQLSYDFPWQRPQRIETLNNASALLEKKSPAVAEALKVYCSDRLMRVDLTGQQQLLTRSVLFGSGQERVVWSVRLGTIALYDIDKNEDDLQMLVGTGALQGARYTWRRAQDSRMRDKLMPLVNNPDSSRIALVPVDVLQNGKIGTEGEAIAATSMTDRFTEWFSNGGLIMYPLLGIAILALLLSVERFITLTIRHHRFEVSHRTLMPLIRKREWDNAAQYCEKRCTGLTRAIAEIVRHRHGGQETAQQHVKQILLAEEPALERRFSLLATLGATAPLLGLLGTVSGMITLFQVITDAGTNDARILAGGISEALITTQTGLMTAIPILLAHGFLTERLDDILSHYNETVQEVFNLVFNRPDINEGDDVY